MNKETVKQWGEEVSKAYDILAFGQTERALEILGTTRDAIRKALQQQQRPINCGTNYCSCIECVMEN
jgi:hypothetical protein